MHVRKAYEIVIKDQIEILIVEGCLDVSTNQASALAHFLSYDYAFHEELNTFIQDYLEVNKHDYE
ncbi:hypothetical protein [Bacillus cereus]|uniref:hypothetical protein n=1 Tax=Bacillus cereus TaxID=1396 RepID=UPI000BEC93E2|nr:hypothetical protein [Bacillus cereus]PEE33579.1 hypothetical protein CON59_24810 [Bacillus cereus]PET46329.1 hypothetical protein CN523_13880 [Bacillus cereus]PEV87493.1 hypothetical protein CN429_02405 [Bacillus cereus]PFA54748.1 hypothetical protein CN389_18740 [Bacillus cereus]PFD62255.1 hypothetical protein CN271_28340 [Bacillus cereus]